MNPTDAYRKELRKKELKRVIYYFHFKFYYYYYLNLGFYLFLSVRLFVKFSKIHSLFENFYSMRVSNKADFFLFDVIIFLLMDLIYYFICSLCYVNLIKKRITKLLPF